MSTSAVWEVAAIEELVELSSRDRQQAGRIVIAVRGYIRDGEGDVKKLTGRRDEWRLRAGDWRVVFTIVGDDAVHVLAIRPRRDAYD